MAIAWSQQAFSFILTEGICSWSTESVVCLHAHCSGQICSDCCWGDKVEPWLRKLQHTGFLAEVAGCSASVCSLETDLLAVRCWTCGCCHAVRVFVFESNHSVRFPAPPTPSSQLWRCYATSINACSSVSSCHAHKVSSLSRLIRVVWVCLRPEECKSNERRDLKQGSMSQR